MLEYSTNLDNWIDALSSHGSFDTEKLDSMTESKLLSFVQITDKLDDNGNDSERISFFISEITPTLEEYMSIRRENIDPDMYEEYDLTDDILKNDYEYEVPTGAGKKKWYAVTVIHIPANKLDKEYVAVFINNRCLLTVNDLNAKGYGRNTEELVDYLIEKTKGVLGSVAIGTYNDDIALNLSYEMRYGIIKRNTYWDILPEERATFRDGLTDKEIEQFIQYAHEESRKKYPDNCMNGMTTRSFFEAAGIAISSVPYKERKCWSFKETQEEYEHYRGTEFNGTTPREIYCKYADGRDDGLTNVPLDDEDAFKEWNKKEGKYYVMNGSHPWEIRTSWSISQSIHLYPQEVHEGRDWKTGNRGVATNKWYFLLDGSAYGTSYEIVKYYLALKKHNIPVILNDMDKIVARYEETDNIGIVPDTVGSYFSNYIPEVFGKHNVIVTDARSLRMSTENILNKDERDKVQQELIENIQWLPQKKLRVKENYHG